MYTKHCAATSGGLEEPRLVGWALTSWGPPQYPYWPSKARYWVRARRGHALQREIEALTNYSIWHCGCRSDHHSTCEVTCRQCGAVAPLRELAHSAIVFGKPVSGGGMAMFCEALLGDAVGNVQITFPDGWRPPAYSQLLVVYELLARSLALEAAAGRAETQELNPAVMALLNHVMDITARWVMQHDRATALRWGLIKIEDVDQIGAKRQRALGDGGVR